MEFLVFILLLFLEFIDIVLLNEMFKKFEDKTKRELELQKNTIDEALKQANLEHEKYKKELMNAEVTIRAIACQIEYANMEIEVLKKDLNKKHLIIKEISIPRANNKRKI